MCGIVGIVATGRGHFDPSAAVRRMAARLRHRGPDADGFHDVDGVHLGMRRLAVIDLSTGDQPIYNEDGSVGVVFNGEIYNFVALRSELEAKGHRFRTTSDTEVIVHLYEEAGADGFARLNGMFALAVHDIARRRVLIARDPHGMKPLYWTRTGAGVHFASEAKALFEHPDVPRRPDPAALVDYLVHWYVPTPRSAFADIAKLRPGHCLVIDVDGGVEERPFGREPAVGPLTLPTLAAAAAATLEALKDAVKRQLTADVPVGVFLSGGLDSALVGALAASLAPERLRGFTVSFGRHGSYDEGPTARTIAQAVGLEHVLVPFPDDPAPLARAALATFDEPFGDYSSIAMTLLCREARRFATVCLAGDGGDEIFGGYPHYLAPRYAALYRRLPRPARAIVARVVDTLPTSFDKLSFDYQARRFVRGAEAPTLEAHLLYKAIFFGAERERLLGPVLGEAAARDPMAGVHEWLAAAAVESSDLERLLALDRLTFMLDDNLVKVDRTSMAASLEVRLPMLDHVVADTAAYIPSRLLLHGAKTKAVLRAVAARILPREVTGLKKMGFTPPLPHWLNGALAPLVDEGLSPAVVERAGLVRPEAVARLVADHRSRRRDRCREIWTLLSLHEWWTRNGF